MPRLDAPIKAAAASFTTRPRPGGATAGHTGARANRVAGPLDTTVTLLECAGLRVCLVATHFGTSGDDVSWTLQNALAAELGIPVNQVVVFSSHNHCVPLLEKRPLTGYEEDLPRSDPTPLGRQFVRQAREAARTLPRRLEPVTVWWAVGREGRITYNRKGRRADGSTYLMREEDRRLVGKDYRGDIDEDAPIVVLRGSDGRIVTCLVQFNGHPVTTYHAERLTVFGEWPQVACRMLADRLSPNGRPIPVSFLQGCCGDVNSKHMFSGDVELSKRYGRYLGAAYITALRSLTRSQRGGMDFAVKKAQVPCKPLPSSRLLEAELREMEDFARRAAAGDEDTLSCVGLNFPRALTPAYRGRLVELVMPWNRWALDLHKRGQAHTAMKSFGVDTYVLRLGDVAVVGMSCEPFTGIGRLMRKLSPLPLTIPCGYANMAAGYVGYITDSANTGDREYMSAFYRYTRYVPPFRKPAGDVMAHKAAELIRGFLKPSADRHPVL